VAFVTPQLPVFRLFFFPFAEDETMIEVRDATEMTIATEIEYVLPAETISYRLSVHTV
jgi:hypothetical protein